MTSQSLLSPPLGFLCLFLWCWALGVAVAAFKFLFDLLAADARNAKLPAGSLLAAVQTFVYCGVSATSVLVVAAIDKAIEKICDLSLKLFSYDLTVYNVSVKQAVLAASVFICLVMAKSIYFVMTKLFCDDK